jgi:hypothetical protein
MLRLYGGVVNATFPRFLAGSSSPEFQIHSYRCGRSLQGRRLIMSRAIAVRERAQRRKAYRGSPSKLRVQPFQAPDRDGQGQML